MRKLQNNENGLLSEEAVDAYLDSIKDVVEIGVSAGTTVNSVALASLSQVNDSLQFVAAINLEVSCDSDPCNEAEAESDALGQVDSSIQTSLSDGSFENTLETNLMDVDDDECGTAFESCMTFQESAAMATATTEVFQREYIIIICDPTAFVSFSTFSPGSLTICFQLFTFR